MSGLNDRDLSAVQEAVAAVRAEGFDVQGVDDLTQRNPGVEFDLTLFADTRTKPMNPVAEAFREAFREAFADLFRNDDEGPGLLVILREDADAEEWARLARKDDDVLRAEVVEADYDEEETEADP